ncbi:hypothetical protein C8J57DRAFT_1537271 [Mycena rebaudengoi]|nr:hypothetical protein C8J57DRAFT_1537271 [Mycena rebaudengoi]
MPQLKEMKQIPLWHPCRHLLARRQLALTGGYAFTDYKVQRQTMGYILIDLEPPPRGKLTPFNAYVALSRSRA